MPYSSGDTIAVIDQDDTISLLVIGSFCTTCFPRLFMYIFKKYVVH